MSNPIQPPAKCHTRHEALMFSGILAQHLPPEMSQADMEAWRNDPEGLAAVLAGLKSPPKPRRIEFQRADGGVTVGVALAGNPSEAADAAFDLHKGTKLTDLCG